MEDREAWCAAVYGVANRHELAIEQHHKKKKDLKKNLLKKEKRKKRKPNSASEFKG